MSAAEAFLADINRPAPARGNVVVGDIPDAGRLRPKKRQQHAETTHRKQFFSLSCGDVKICIQTHLKKKAGSKTLSTKPGLPLNEILWHVLGNASSVTT